MLRPVVTMDAGGAPWIVPVDYAPDGGPADEPSQIVRVLVVARDPLARMGLAAMAAGLAGCRVVGDVPDDAELSEAIDRLDPDLVVWDLGPAAPAPEERTLGEAAPPVLLLASRDFPGLSAGTAAAVLRRDSDAATLGAAIHAVAKGLTVLDPAFSQPAAPPRDRTAVELSEALTPREVEVLQWLAAGLPNKVIAERLRISEHTVRFHLNAIFGKLDAHTRTEAVSRAARLGLIVL